LSLACIALLLGMYIVVVSLLSSYSLLINPNHMGFSKILYPLLTI